MSTGSSAILFSLLALVYFAWLLIVLKTHGPLHTYVSAFVLSLPFNSTLLIPKAHLSITTVLLVPLAAILPFYAYFLLRKVVFIRIVHLMILQVSAMAGLIVATLCTAVANATGIGRPLLVTGSWIAAMLVPQVFITDRDSLKIVLATIALSTVSLAVVSLGQSLGWIDPVVNEELPYRIVGVRRALAGSLFGIHYLPILFGYVGFVDYGIAAIVAIVALLARESGNSDRRLLGVGRLLGVALIITLGFFTRSRTVWLLMILASVLVLMLGKPRNKETYLAFVVAASLVASAIAMAEANGISNIRGAILNLRSVTVSARLDLIEHAIEVIGDNPILGIGLRRFDVRVIATTVPQDVHNVLLSYLVSLGYVGTTFVALIVAVPLILAASVVVVHQKWGLAGEDRMTLVLPLVLVAGLLVAGTLHPLSHNKYFAFYLGLATSASMVYLGNVRLWRTASRTS